MKRQPKDPLTLEWFVAPEWGKPAADSGIVALDNDMFWIMSAPIPHRLAVHLVKAHNQLLTKK